MARSNDSPAAAARTPGALARAARALLAFVLALGAAPQLSSAPEAWAAPAEITRVADDEWEPAGYGESIEWTDVQAVSGFVSIPYDEENTRDYPGITQYYRISDESTIRNYATGAGYAAFLDDNTGFGTYSLRFTGGEYDGRAVDMIVTLESWNVEEPWYGWEGHHHYGDYPTFQPGVYVALEYDPYALYSGELNLPDDGAHNNVNFYTVGLTELTVSIAWVYSGTDEPAEVKGHFTCIDLDAGQSFAYDGAVVGARILDANDFLSTDGTKATAPDDPLVEDASVDFEAYGKGLVTAYYDTTEEAGNLGEPAVVSFGTSWPGYYSDGPETTESFFALTTEFLTATYEKDPPGGEKTADKESGASVGDEITYTIDFEVFNWGENARLGWRYESLEVVDALPAELSYVDGSGYLVDADGRAVEGAGEVVYSSGDNTVRFEFSASFLETLDLLGQTYSFVFKAVLTEYPADGSLSVENDASVIHNRDFVVGDLYVRTELVEPVLSVDKTADAYEYEVGDVITFTAVFEQTAANAQARGTVLSDDLPTGLELIESSVTATGPPGMPQPAFSDNGWSYDIDKLDYGYAVVVTYQAIATSSGNGYEIVNNAAARAINATGADDPAEVWINTADVSVAKSVDRYEGYVGASDADPGFFEYAVTVANDKEGTIARNVVVTDDTLPEGMVLGTNANGSLMVALYEDGEELETSWTGDAATGTLSSVSEPVAEEDYIHNQTQTITPTWTLTPEGTGWRLAIDSLGYGQTVTVVYRAYPDSSVAGWEIVNEATAEADNDPDGDEDDALVWVNQPELVIEKTASNDTFTVNDVVTYHVTITNATAGSVGRNLVFADLVGTEGVELLRESVHVYDSEGNEITDSCKITYDHESADFIIETYRTIVSEEDSYTRWEAGEETAVDAKNPLGITSETLITVEYRVQIQDADLAGKTVENTAYAEADEPNTETSDDETVNVKGARLVTTKAADKDAYEAGETARYTVTTTQTREDVTAKNVVVADALDDPESLSIVEGTLVVYGPDGEALADAVVTYDYDDHGCIVGYTAETGLELADEETATVTYDAIAKAAAESARNVASSSADNAIGSSAVEEVVIVDPYAVVEFEKSVDANAARVGDAVTYALTAVVVENDAQNLVIGDHSLPDGMPIDFTNITLTVDGQGRVPTVVADGNGFDLYVGTVSAGSVAVVTYQAAVEDEELVGTTVVNTAILDADNLEEPLTDYAYVTIYEDEPEIEFAKSADAEEVAVGGAVTYTVSATVASGDAKNVVVSDTSLPSGMPIDLDAISVAVNGQTADSFTATIIGNGFQIAFGNLSEGDTVEVAYTAAVEDASLAGTTVVNTAILTSDSLDDPIEDAEEVVVIDGDPTATIAKTADAETASPGDAISYLIAVEVGLYDLTEVVVIDDTLPEGTTVVDGTLEVAVDGVAVEAGTVSDGNDIVVAFETLPAGSVVEISYDVLVSEDYEGDEIVNVAILDAGNLPEPQSSEVVVEVDAPGAGVPEGEETTDPKGSESSLDKTGDEIVSWLSQYGIWVLVALACATGGVYLLSRSRFDAERAEGDDEGGDETS